MYGQPQHVLDDPCRRQEGDVFVGVGAWVHLHVDCGASNDATVGDHHRLGRPCRARGVAEDGQVVPLALRHQFLKEVGLLPVQRLPLGLDFLKADQPRFVVAPQPLLLPVDDPPHLRHLLPDLQQLVTLLLVLGQDEGGVGMVNEVPDLAGDAVGEDAHGHSLGGLHRQLGPVVLRVVVADDADLIAPLQAQTDHPQRKPPDVPVGFLPGELPPDAQVLLAHGDLAVTILLHSGQEILGKGIQFSHLSQCTNYQCTD